MLSHLGRLIRADGQVRAWPAGTQQGKSRLTILGEKRQRILLIDFAWPLNVARAGQAPALMAHGGKIHALGEGCVPDVLVWRDSDSSFAIGRQELNVEGLSLIGALVHGPALNSAARLLPGQHRRMESGANN